VWGEGGEVRGEDRREEVDNRGDERDWRRIGEKRKENAQKRGVRRYSRAQNSITQDFYSLFLSLSLPHA
jgi:hypothetical protein